MHGPDIETTKPTNPQRTSSLPYFAVMVAVFATVCGIFMAVRTLELQRQAFELLDEAKAGFFPEGPDVRMARRDAAEQAAKTPPADVAFHFGDRVRITKGFWAGWGGRILYWDDGKFGVSISGRNAENVQLLRPVTVQKLPADYIELDASPPPEDSPSAEIHPSNPLDWVPEVPSLHDSLRPLRHRMES